MAKEWFSVKAEAKPKAAAIAIRGAIGEWGSVTDRDLIAQVEALGELDEITVSINTRGGDMDHGVGIFNFLLNHPAKVTVRVDGVAMSSGSIIAMAGDKIIMPANAVMMIHNPWVMTAGNAKQLRARAEMLDKFEAALCEIYMARTGKTEEEIKAMLEGPDGDGLYLTAAEAKAEGFADEVEAIRPRADASAMAMVMASAMDIPPAVLAKLQKIEDEAGSDPTQDNADPVVAQINAVIVAAGFSDHAAVWLLDDKIATVEDAKAAVAQAREVAALCNAAGKPEEVGNLIRARATLADARQRLTDILAQQDEETHTSNHQPTKTSKPAQSAQPAALKPADVWAARRKQLH